MKLLLVFCLIVASVGCSSEPPRQYNHEDSQDPDCWAHYGAMPGYCSQFFHRGRPQ